MAHTVRVICTHPLNLHINVVINLLRRIDYYL